MALQEIAASVENKMIPPRWFPEKKPDRALANEEIQQLAEWADNEARKISEK